MSIRVPTCKKIGGEIKVRKERQRVCKRCNALYYSFARTSKYCPKCYRGKHFKETFGELNKGSKKDVRVRIDKDLLDRLEILKQPIKLNQGHTKESYADVIRRLLRDPNITARMQKEKEDAQCR